MARTIEVIKQQMIDEKNAQAELAGLTSTSQASIWLLWIFIQAVAINLFEQVIDIFKSEIETTVSTGAVETNLWIRDKVLNLFQYDATTPQVINLIDFVPNYPAIDSTKRIVTQASVLTDNNKVVQIKVAKGNPPVALAAPELSALKSFIDAIAPAGVQPNVVSLASDKVKITAEIFYNGQYAAIIEANVIAALDAFLFSIPFDGILKVSDIEQAILAVAGVSDVILNIVRTRADATTPASGTLLVDGNDVLIRRWPTVAGYIVGETNGGETFANTLTFTVE